MELGKTCPNCKTHVSIWRIVLAPLPNRIRCPHCRARLRFRDARRTLWLLICLAIVIAGVALFASGLYRATIGGVSSRELFQRCADFAALTLLAWFPVEVAAAWFLRKNKAMECVAPGSEATLSHE